MKKPNEDKVKKGNGNRVSRWFKGYGNATREEFHGRIFSSIKRIIKFLGLSIVPILYAVICIAAFWNPIPNIGKANITFIDQEQEMLVATHSKIDTFGDYVVYADETPSKDDKSGDFMSALLEKKDTKDASGKTVYEQKHNYADEKSEDLTKRLTDWIKDGKLDEKNGTFRVSIDVKDGETDGLDDIVGGFPPIEKGSIKYVYRISAFDMLNVMGILHNGNDPKSNNEDQTYSTGPITNEKIDFNNIHYQRWQNSGHKTWKSYKSYVQIKMPDSFARSLLDFVTYYFYGMSEIIKDPLNIIKNIDDLIMSLKHNQLPRVVNNNIQIWTTFARNFIFGYYMNTINQFKEAIPIQIIKSFVDKFISDPNIINFINNNPEIGSVLSDLLKIGDIVQVEIEGANNGIYGIGLGEFFVLIGLYVGTLMHTFVYDRAKRGGSKVTHSQWYFSKLTLLVTTGFIQTTLLTFALVAVGWHQLGVERILELYGGLLLMDFTFKITIMGIWFSVKDETIGKFICVIYMILNLSSGWGTFPAWMQFSFFHGVSYVTEFTYALHLMGVIIYGGNYSGDWVFALQQVGFLLCFVVVFMTLGFFMSINRNLEMHFGTYRKRHIIEGLNSFGENELAENIKKIGWKAIPRDEVREDLVEYMRVNHPFEKQFKKYKTGNHPKPIKPNYTDDDIMSRNDDIEV